MPPKNNNNTEATATASQPAITSVSTLRQAFRDLAINQVNIPDHQGTFAVDVVAAFPDLAKIYIDMFGDRRTDLTKMATQAVKEGRYTIPSGLEGGNNTAATEYATAPLSTRARKAIDLFLDDCQIIHDNCVQFNGTANNLPQLAAQMLDMAKKRGELLYKRLNSSTYLQQLVSKQQQQQNNNKSGSSTTTNSVARTNNNNIRQRNEEVERVSTTSGVANSNKKEEIAVPEVSLQDMIRQTAEQFKNHPLVSGPVAVTVPRKIQERIATQHLAFVEKFKNNKGTMNSQLSSEDAVAAAASNSVNNHDNNNNKTIDVLLDFFASFCAKNLQVSKDDVILKTFLLTSKNDLIQALETSEVSNPRNFLQQQTSADSSKKHQANTTIPPPQSNRRIEQYWAVLARVILPWFNATAMTKFVYLDEKVNALSELMKIQMKEEKNSFSSSSTTTPKPYWHKILHFDILVRSLLELPLVSKVVLKDTLDRGYSSSNNNNNSTEPVAANIVQAAIVPVVNDLLEFIAEERI